MKAKFFSVNVCKKQNMYVCFEIMNNQLKTLEQCLPNCIQSGNANEVNPLLCRLFLDHDIIF